MVFVHLFETSEAISEETNAREHSCSEYDVDPTQTQKETKTLAKPCTGR